MKQQDGISRRHASALALALVLAMISPLVPTPVLAERRCLPTQQDAPLETARRLKELTAGGLFNPVQSDPCETRAASDSQDGGDTPPPALPLGHNLW